MPEGNDTGELLQSLVDAAKPYTGNIDTSAVRHRAENVLRNLNETERHALETQLSVRGLLGCPAELYEQVVGIDLKKAGEAVGKPNVKKDIDLLGPIFMDGKIVECVDAVGVVPQRVYSSKKFESDVSFAQLANAHAALKGAQEGRNIAALQSILRARAQLLTELFLRGKVTPDMGGVSIDTNGLWIQLDQRKKGAQYTLHAHLPYAYASEELLKVLQTQGWLREGDITEARLRRAEDLHDPLTTESAEDEKLRLFLKQENLSERTEYKQAAPDRAATLRLLAHDVLTPYGRARTEAATHIPLSVVDAKFAEPNIHPSYPYLSIIGYAEDMQRTLAGDANLPETGYERYDLPEASRTSVEARRSILRSPKNYDVVRMIGRMLECMETAPEGKKEYQLLRGALGDEEDAVHFLEVVTEHGNVSRVLIDPDKHFSKKQQELFRTIPRLEKDEFELFETQALALGRYRKTAMFLEEMARIISPLSENMTTQEHRKYVQELMHEANAFLLMEDPVRYAQARALYETFMSDESAMNPDSSYVTIFNQSLEEFGKRLFQKHPKDALHEMPLELHRHTVRFDATFVESFPHPFKEKTWTWDPQLCDELNTLNYAVTVVDAGKSEIPYAMEARAIRALRLQRDRPLITVIGGCRDLPRTDDGTTATEQLCASIVTAADKLKANVVPPGTQSGIGIVMGRAAVAYAQKNKGRAPTETARFFAVSPGGETYHPENENLATPRSDTDPRKVMAYAIAPFDSVLTPFEAGWDWEGEAKALAPYFRHIEYAEAIYHRVSAGQPRVTVVGNGGLFTIVEAVAALKNDSSMILVKDSGRFADLAIAMQNRSALGGSREDWERGVLGIIEVQLTGDTQRDLLKAFGTQSPTVEQQLYRDKLHEFFVHSEGRSIAVADAGSLEEAIAKSMQKAPETA